MKPVDEATADAIYRAVLRHYPHYGDTTEDRVLAACIDWRATKTMGLTARYAVVSYKGPDVGVKTLDELENLALGRCNGNRVIFSLQCTCAPVLRNESVVFGVPENVTLGDNVDQLAVQLAKSSKAQTLRERIPKPRRPITLHWDGKNDFAKGSAQWPPPEGGAGEMHLWLHNYAATCTGHWRWTDGDYVTSDHPRGVWFIACTNGLAANGTFASTKRVTAIGIGQDMQGRQVIFNFGH